MPKIPRAEQTRSIPGVSGGVETSISQAGVAGRGVSKIADQVGDIVSERASVLKDQDRTNKQILLRSQYDDDHRAFKGSESQKTGSDSFENVERGKDFRASMIKKYAGGIEDPGLKAATTQYINSRSSSMLDSLSLHQSKQRSAVSQQARGLTMDGLLKDAFSGESLEDINTRWTATVAEQNNLGIISEEEAIEELKVGQSSLAEAHLDGLIDADPTAAIEAINDGTYNEFLTQQQQEDFAKKANALEKARDNDIKNREKEQERLNKIAIKEAQTETGNNFLEQNLNGTLTQAEVLASNLNPTGENSKKTWIKEIEARAKKVKSNDEEWNTNKQVEANLQTKITLDPESVTDGEIMALQGQGLSTEDAKGLVAYRAKRLGKDDDPQKTQDAKLAYRRLQDAKSAKLYSGNKVENSTKWADDVSQLSQWINTHPNDDPADYVDQLLEPAKDGVMRRMFDFLPGVDPFESEEARERELDIEAGIGPDATDFGLRSDKTKKGTGFLGVLKRPDGDVATEVSVGVNIGGNEIEIPTLVPGLTQPEIDEILNLSLSGGEFPSKPIMDKAVAHAKKRIAAGKSPFLQPGEKPEARKATGTKKVKTQIFKRADGTYYQKFPNGTIKDIPKPEGL